MWTKIKEWFFSYLEKVKKDEHYRALVVYSILLLIILFGVLMKQCGGSGDSHLVQQMKQNVSATTKGVEVVKNEDGQMISQNIALMANNKELRNTIRWIHEDIINYSTTVIRHINYVKDKYTTI